MKISFYAALLVCSITVMVWSCKKKSDTPAPATTTTTTNTTNNNTTPPTSIDMKTGLNKKWTTGNSSTSRIATTPSPADYVSFEFNASGNYYIIKADKSMIMGTYTLNTADSIVTLFNGSSTTSQYGTLSISKITETSLIFKLELPSVPAIDITATAVTTSVGTSTVNTANTTAQIAKAWQMDSIKQGSVVTRIPSNMYAHFVLTEGGTYWTETYNGPGTTVSIVNGQWKWSDNANTSICGSSTDVAPDCTNNQSAVSFDTHGNFIMTTTATGQTTKIYYFSVLTL